MIIEHITNLFGQASVPQLLLLLVLLPTLLMIVMLGWMLLVSRGKESTTINLTGLGISLNLSASKSPTHIEKG